MAVALVPHPDNPTEMHQRVAATLARLPGGLSIAYAIRGDIDSLRLPTPATPAPAEALWRTSCCELFVANEGGGGYREFNFSPSGQWAVYDFSGYRERAATQAAVPAPAIAMRREGDALHLDVELPAAALPAGALRLGISAVLETHAGRIGWWALAHASGKPDFHHPSAFVLTLDKDVQ